MSVVMEQPKIKKSKTPKWLCPIPAHWDICRNGRLFRELKLKGNEDLPILTVSIHDGVTVRDMSDDNHRQMMQDKTKYQRLEKGDIAYNMMRMWQGAVGVAPVDGLVSPAYVCARPFPEANAKYYEYLFRTPIYMGEVEGYSRGIVSDRNRLYWEGFKQIPSPCPPREEQDAIVAFLDGKLEEIDRFIANKRRLIELLEEERRSKIESLIRRSECEKEIKLGYYIDLVSGYAFGSDGFSNDVNDIRLLRGINISPGSIRWEADETVRWPVENIKHLGQWTLKEGDIVFGMDRPWISAGIRVAKLNSTDVPSLLLQRVCRIRTRLGLDRDYLLLLLAGAEFHLYFEPILTGVSVPHISPGQIKAFRVRIPDETKQRAIVTKIEALDYRIDQAIAAATQEIELMSEFRISLITETVTGKIDNQV